MTGVGAALRPAAAGAIVQGGVAPFEEALLPDGHSAPTHSELPGHRRLRQAARQQQDDPASPFQPGLG
jgi:hypothetical protein